MNDQIECLNCGWQGSPGELVCSDEDDASDKKVSEIKFNICPQCGEVDDFEDLEDEQT